MINADPIPSSQTSRVSYSTLGWLGGWLIMLVLLTTGLLTVQRRVVTSLDKPEVRAQWQLWKQEAQRQTKLGAGPVQRKAPRTNEPPALILMRDHFPAVWGCSTLLMSCLYTFLAIAMRGAVRTHSRPLSGGKEPLGRPPTSEV